MEEGLLDVIESLEADGANILELAGELNPIEYGEGEGHDHGDHDDHEGHDHGDEEGHKDDEDGHDHDDHSAVAHSCLHFDDEPTAVSTGGEIPDDHTRYSIELANGSASVTLDWDEESELSFFLSADAPISLVDGAGNELAAEAIEAVGEECEAIALVASFDLEPGTYTVEIGPLDGADAIDLVWEETGHHGDEEGHMDEEGHDHGDEEGHHDEEGDHDHEDEGEHHDEEGHDHEDEGEHHDEEGHDHGDEEGHKDDEDGHDHDDHEGHDHGSHDPHVWMDPLRVAEAAELIAEKLANLDSSVDWMANATAYADQLRALDAEVVSTLAAVSEDRRKLVTNHDAFGYFAERYDFEVVGTVIPGGSTLADPSSAELAELVEVLVDENINVIFTETTEPAALAEAVASEVDDVAVVELFTGSLSEPEAGAETYIDYVRTNASRIADALS